MREMYKDLGSLRPGQKQKLGRTGIRDKGGWRWRSLLDGPELRW